MQNIDLKIELVTYIHDSTVLKLEFRSRQSRESTKMELDLAHAGQPGTG